MASLRLPLHSYRVRGGQASTSRLLNAMIEQLPPDAKTPALLTRAPAVASWGTVGTGPIEGLYADHGLLYAVSGGGFYSVTSTPTATFRGAVGSSTEIDMDSNTTAVVIVSPPNAFHYTPGTTTFGQITDTDFTTRGAGDVEFADNFMLFRQPDTGIFFGADLGSVTAFDALNFATAEGSPDTTVGLKVDQRQVLQFGERSLELWQNTGASGFPFTRLEPGFVERGCANGRTVAKLDQSVFWVDESLIVRRLDGLTPVRVSTHAVEQWLKTVTLVSLRGWSWSLEGHLCYALTAPEGCWVFDVTTQLWHERATYGSVAWNWGSPVAFAGKILVGSTTSNVIGELTNDAYADLADTNRAEWSYQPVRRMDGHRRQFHHSLEVEIEVGVGLTTGQGSDPQIMLDVSEDSGKTWRALPNKSIGPIGQYRKKVRWTALGSSEGTRTYRMAVSDPVKVSVYDTRLDHTGGTV